MLTNFLTEDRIEDLKNRVEDSINQTIGTVTQEYYDYLRTRGLNPDESMESEEGVQDYNQLYNAVLVRLFRY